MRWLWQKGDDNQCFVQAFRFPPSWQIKGSELSIGLQVNELNGFHFVSPRSSFFCNAIVWSIANPLLSEGGTRCYSSQRQFPHWQRLSVPLPISSTLFPRALFYIFFLFRTMYLKRLQISNNCRRLSVPMSISSTFFPPSEDVSRLAPLKNAWTALANFPAVFF